VAGVPNTTNFSLQDVVDVISPSHASLQACFDNASDEFFDPLYVGSKNSLYNFRNYGGSVVYWKEYDTTSAASGFVLHNNSAWATVRGAATGTSVNTTTNWDVWVDYTGGVYYINRAFMRFDLSIIPASATCEAAGLGFDAFATYGASIYPLGLIGTQGSSVTVEDFDAFTFSNYYFSNFTAGPSTPFEGFDYSLEAIGAGQLASVEAAFGGYLYVAIINGYYDNGNNTPTSKQGMTIFKAGEVQATPEMRIVFTI